MEIEKYLAPSETVLSEFKPFYATSQRIIRLYAQPSFPKKPEPEVYALEMPYHQITSVELRHQPKHAMMAMGTVMVLLGLLLLLIPFVTAVFAILVGIGFLFLGSVGKPGYYQLRARELPRWAERYWQVDYQKSGSFIATVRYAVGQMPDF